MGNKFLMRDIEAVDLFCGAGGLSFGLNKIGINVVAGVDIDPACSYPFKVNNNAEFINSSVNDVAGEDLKKFFSPDAIKVLAGCAPCQPFSSYSQGSKARKDDQWSLLRQFQRLIVEVSPDIITMENVPALLRHSVFQEFIDSLKNGEGTSSKYSVSFKVVDCDKYGLPQTRRRLVLLASKLGEISLNAPTRKKKCVKRTIGRLMPLSAGEADPKDPLHQSANLSPLNLSRIKQSRPGGTWRDWDSSLVAECHKKQSGSTYPSVYGRMEWDKPSPTITTQFFGYGNGRFGHPEQNRAITLREGAMLQSFPKSYKFVRKNMPVNLTVTGRLIGNAVPPLLGEIIGESIKAHLKQNNVSLPHQTLGT
jgi:DNA (cytosine-5)-methyltransferase 1